MTGISFPNENGTNTKFGIGLMADSGINSAYSRRRRTFTLVALPQSYIFIFPDASRDNIGSSSARS